jgi:hypothetical protein
MQPQHVLPMNLISNQCSLIACVHCRKAHRKCDRRLPNCSECVCRGFGDQCTYAAPRKRGPKQTVPVKSESKKRSNSSDDSPTPLIKIARYTEPLNYPPTPYDNNTHFVPQGAEHTLMNHPMETHDTMFEPVKVITPIPSVFRYDAFQAQAPANPVSFSPGLFQLSEPAVSYDLYHVDRIQQLNYRMHTSALLNFYFDYQGSYYPLFDRQYLESLAMSCFSTKNEIICKNPDEEQLIAMLLSSYALSLQRMGKKHVAYEVYLRAREIISRYFDTVSNSFAIAAAMSLSAYYLLGQGDTSRAKVLFYNTKLFQEDKKSFIEHQEYDALSQFSIQLQFLFNDTNLIDQIFCLEPIVYERIIDESLDKSSLNQDVPIESQMDSTINILDRLSSEILEYISSQIQEKNIETKYLSTMKLTYEIVFLGLRLKLLSLSSAQNHMQQTRQIADQISSLSSNPLIHNCSILVIEAIIYASSLHLQDKNTSTNILKLDLATLNSLAQSFDVISSKYTYIMSGIDERLRKEVIVPPVTTNYQMQHQQIPSQAINFQYPAYSQTMEPFDNNANQLASPNGNPLTNTSRGSKFMDLLQSNIPLQYIRNNTEEETGPNISNEQSIKLPPLRSPDVSQQSMILNNSNHTVPSNVTNGKVLESGNVEENGTTSIDESSEERIESQQGSTGLYFDSELMC